MSEYTLYDLSDDIDTRTDLVEEIVGRNTLDVLCIWLRDPLLHPKCKQELIGVMTRWGFPRQGDLEKVLKELLQHPNKYLFLGALQLLLRWNPKGTVLFCDNLEMPDERRGLAKSLIQVLADVGAVERT
jgi:hypothetical protein